MIKISEALIRFEHEPKVSDIKVQETAKRILQQYEASISRDVPPDGSDDKVS